MTHPERTITYLIPPVLGDQNAYYIQLKSIPDIS